MSNESDRLNQSPTTDNYDLFEVSVHSMIEKLRKIDNRTIEQEGLFLLMYNALMRNQNNKDVIHTINMTLGVAKEQTKQIENLLSAQQQLTSDVNNITLWKIEKNKVDMDQSARIDNIVKDVTELVDDSKWTLERIAKVGGFFLSLIGAIVTLHVFYLKDIFVTKEGLTETTTNIINKVEDFEGYNSDSVKRLSLDINEKFKDLRTDFEYKTAEDARQTQLLTNLIIEIRLINYKLGITDGDSIQK